MTRERPTLEDKIERIVRGLEKCGAEKGILFGSSARGTTDEWSDVDLIVVQRTEKRFLDRLGEVMEAIDANFALDVLVYTPEEFDRMRDEERPFLMHALEEGKVIYEKPQG